MAEVSLSGTAADLLAAIDSLDDWLAAAGGRHSVVRAAEEDFMKSTYLIHLFVLGHG